MGAIHPITVPKWGMAMEEGKITSYLKPEGASVAKGDELVEIESSKIANVVEAETQGVMRRHVARIDETLPCGGLVAIVTEGDVGDAEIEAFISSFVVETPEGEAGGPAAAPEMLEADGWRLRVLKRGKGDAQPVLFIHGFGGDLNNWLFTQGEIARDRLTIAIDLPGHGGSQKQVLDGALGALADAVHAAMHALGEGPWHVIGHSLGAAVALKLAEDVPVHIASLTLICPAGLGREISGAYLDGFMNQTRRRDLMKTMEALFANPGLVTPDMAEDIIKFKRLDGAEAALRSIAASNFPGGVQANELRRLAGAVRTQIIWGADDKIIPPAHAAGLPSSIAVHVINGAGHMPHMEKAAEVNALITAFLAGH